MSEKSTMIVNATLNSNEKEAFKYYAENSAPIFKKAGGVPLSKYKISETIIGQEVLQLIAIMEFPNKNVIKSVFNSEAYKALLPYRDKAFSSLNVFISEN